ncbi:MAG: methyltransferase [Flavipsychrobacter sp.]|nr:methyltransferase [Flavipsychrobacter sp.]
MSNSYFRFKQFNIDQEHCAMKVTTDACIQGAWTPLLPHVHRALDIGAGTGLLSLMLAQRNADITIDAIELDNEAATQASNNVAASSWENRINIIAGDVCTHPFSCRYDMIISNPPFFNNSLLSDKQNKNLARHTLSLTYTDLLNAISANLSDDGYASVLLPYAEYKIWQSLLLKGGWVEFNRLEICHSPNAAVKRVICVFGKKELEVIQQETLVIKDTEGKYMPQFTALLSPYYLDL